jgi:hypothetical protein
MTFFKEIQIGKFVLRFMPSDNGWMCGISKEMMEGLEEQAEEFLMVPYDPTPDMKTAAVNIDLFDHDTGKDYTLSWEEAEEIYSSMINSSGENA